MTTSEFFYNDKWNKTLEAAAETNMISEDALTLIKNDSKMIGIDEKVNIKTDSYISYICLINPENKEVIETCLEEVLGTRMSINVIYGLDSDNSKSKEVNSVACLLVLEFSALKQGAISNIFSNPLAIAICL